MIDGVFVCSAYFAIDFALFILIASRHCVVSFSNKFGYTTRGLCGFLCFLILIEEKMFTIDILLVSMASTTVN